MTRRASINPNIPSFSEAIYLFSTNEAVIEHNKRKLASDRQPVAEIEAVHNNSTARQGSDSLAGGLFRKLYLSMGSRIMLRKNMCGKRFG